MTQDDPTDHALAAIASILDQPDHHREPQHHPAPESSPDEVEENPLAPEMLEAAGYSKVGPGPMAAIRFKWTVRHDADEAYYVDETIGENSSPIISGPMSGNAAIRFVDERESDARRRFEQLRSEMTGRAEAAILDRHDGGEVQ